MSNPHRVIDKTYLSLDAAEERGLIHRDYIAHCLRWSHVVKFLNRGHTYKEAIVLDVGCGKEMPLAKTLYVNKMSARHYIGVDANKFTIPDMLRGRKLSMSAWSETDVCALDITDVSFNGALPNILTCFEVLEHVTPEHCRRMLQKFQELTSPDAHYFISTPCWNGSAAANHINEMAFYALGALIEDLEYKIEGVYGTFASISDYKDYLHAVPTTDGNYVDMRSVFNSLREYYDTNLLSVIFAPLFPAQSRNCLWHLVKLNPLLPNEKLFTLLGNQPTPWSQHPRWEDLNK